MDRVAKDKVVEIHFTLRRQDGQIEESTEGEPPLPYLHGAGNIPVGLERALEGRSTGERFSITLAPAEAYGEYDDEAIDEISLDAFPEGTQLTEGEEIYLLTDEGEEIGGFIESISEGSVFVNFNHPLAGETLTFDVEVGAVRDATAEELEHGHAHDPYMAAQDGGDEDDEEWDEEDEEWDEDDEEWDEEDEEWDEDDEEWDEEDEA